MHLPKDNLKTDKGVSCICQESEGKEEKVEQIKDSKGKVVRKGKKTGVSRWKEVRHQVRGLSRSSGCGSVEVTEESDCN